ncbi:serine O-acetyltransferase [Lactobacillus sp. PV034]|uniref:serine O-acetyltransferase n=1 Tax=Lactobacillus sp. PV034 TaxID=2594495 RepID=UPI00223E93C5|nr:serine acetyltransferase [Lactobacillus sp. PV034]QNQ80523.1 serine acetyltransferase [Lactobacillus sp. PV034]
MKYSPLKQLIKSDVVGYDNSLTSVSLKNFLVRYIKTPGFKVTTWMRICKYLSTKRFSKMILFMARLKYRKLQVKYGIQIGYKLQIKGGFAINHYGGIVIGSGAKIGSNFDIRHSITIGHVDGKTPIIGNNVSVGANVIILGNCTIGDNVIIGAGSVVVKSIPSNSIVVGNPAKVIKKINKIHKRI